MCGATLWARPADGGSNARQIVFNLLVGSLTQLSEATSQYAPTFHRIRQDPIMHPDIITPPRLQFNIKVTVEDIQNTYKHSNACFDIFTRLIFYKGDQ